MLANGPSVSAVAPTPNAGLGQGVFSVDPTLGSGYVQQWNAAVQQSIGADISLEVAYVGSKITHVGIPDTNLNQLTADQLAVAHPVQRQAETVPTLPRLTDLPLRVLHHSFRGIGEQNRLTEPVRGKIPHEICCGGVKAGDGSKCSGVHMIDPGTLRGVRQ